MGGRKGKGGTTMIQDVQIGKNMTWSYPPDQIFKNAGVHIVRNPDCNPCKNNHPEGTRPPPPQGYKRDDYYRYRPSVVDIGIIMHEAVQKGGLHAVINQIQYLDIEVIQDFYYLSCIQF